jgi:peptide/nickel transport system permease protein
VALVRFLLRRLGSSAMAVVGASLLVFLFLHIVPGDPVDNLAGGDATPEQRREIMRCMHLDRPLAEQVGIFFANVLNGTLGRQCPDPKGNSPTVAAMIRQVLPYTAELAAVAILLAVVLALPLGIVAAVRRGTLWEAAATAISFAGISIPLIWMGPMALSVFFLNLGWAAGPGEKSVILPACVLATHLMAMLARMTRSSMLEVMGEDYMRTARAKGLPPGVVLLKHGLRNALLPVITVVGMQTSSLLAGAVISERVFSRPGLGTLLFEAISTRNYPIIQGCVFVVAIVVVAVNLLVDLAYGVADPRIRRA